MSTYLKRTQALIAALLLALGLALGFAGMQHAYADEGGEGDAQEVTAFDYYGTNVNFINSDGGQFGMFTPMEGTAAVLADGNVQVTYYPKSPTVYKGFYLNRTIDEFNANKESLDTWAVEDYVAADENGNYTFTVPESYCGKAWPVAPSKKSEVKTTSSQYYLAIPTRETLEDQAAAADAVSKINSIGEVTADSKAAIEAARAAYNALSDAQKALVSEETLKILADAEAAYAEIEKAAEPEPVAPAKTANSITIKKAKVTVNLKANKKGNLAKKQTIDVKKLAKKVTAKTTPKYSISKVTKAKFKKYFSINAKTGKVAVKKGLKKGKYTVKVKVTAAADETYEAAKAKTITLTVKVK